MRSGSSPWLSQLRSGSTEYPSIWSRNISVLAAAAGVFYRFSGKQLLSGMQTIGNYYWGSNFIVRDLDILRKFGRLDFDLPVLIQWGYSLSDCFQTADSYDLVKVSRQRLKFRPIPTYHNHPKSCGGLRPTCTLPPHQHVHFPRFWKYLFPQKDSSFSFPWLILLLLHVWSDFPRCRMWYRYPWICRHTE